MSTYSSPVDVSAATLARSATVNNLDAACATAFGLLPDETKLKLGTVQHAVDTGSANAYLVALTHTPASYTDGMVVIMRPINANTGASTINVNSLGVKSIRREDSTAVTTGDILVGVPILLVYSTATGFFHTVGGLGVATAAAASAAAAASSASGASSSASASAASAAAALASQIAAAASAAAALVSELAAAASAASIAGGPVASINGLTGVVTIAATDLAAAASQAEMEAGTQVALRSMSPLRVAQAIASISAAGDHAIKLTTGNGFGSSSTAIRRYSVSTVVGTHAVYADSSTLGTTITIAAGGGGLYEISVQDSHSASDTYVGASLNSAELTTAIQTITAANRLLAHIHGTGISLLATRTVRLVAGDVVRPHMGTTLPNSTSAVNSTFAIRKVGL